MTSVEDCAREYCSWGWRVLPIRPGTKVPPMKGWQHAASADPDIIRKWWGGLYPDAGVGIATGQESGVWVLDIDAGHGGIETLKLLVAEYGPLPKGPRVNTPSGGFHLYFDNPTGLHAATTKNIGGRGIDVRGDGGQVLAPPTIHPNGGVYVWNRPMDGQLPTAPDWLLDLVVPERQPKVKPPDVAPSLQTNIGGSAAAEIAAHYQWHNLLLEDGWQCSKQSGTDTLWVRPGKDPRLGTSAVLHEPDGPFVNYSSAATGLMHDWARSDKGDGWAYSIFGYVAATRYDGDRSEAASDWVRRRTSRQMDDWMVSSVALPSAGAIDGPGGFSLSRDGHGEALLDLSWAHLIEWDTFWKREHVVEEWAVWPLVPAGRSIALFAPAKAGKSTVTLAAVAAAAVGHKVFGSWEPPNGPVDILYLDYEMTEEDIWERLSDLGYGPEVDMSHLHYAMLPSIFPLDTEKGAFQILHLARSCGAKVVVIDTFSRAVTGDENDADTSRDFYRYTGMALKSAGIACLRTDHAGKEVEKGQRGSSAKNDDVDIVWSLSRNDGGIQLRRTHSRVTWVPENINLVQVEHDDGTTVYRIANQRSWPEGTKELAGLMDRLAIPVEASARQATALLRDAGESARNEKIRHAQQYRKSLGEQQDWLLEPPTPPAPVDFSEPRRDTEPPRQDRLL